MRTPDEHPTDVNWRVEPLSLTERAVYGDTTCCLFTGRPLQVGSGAHSPAIQSALYVAEDRKGARLSELEAQLIIQGGKPPA
jgi:hypothetical protein